MEAREYNFKFSYLYPFMSLMLYFILSLLLFYLIDLKSGILALNKLSYLILFIFMLEAVFHFNASQEIKLPFFVYLVEFAAYFLVLAVFNGRLGGLAELFSIGNLDIFLFTLISILLWTQVISFAELFEYFRKDFDKIYDRSSDSWNLDEFRRLLDYPLIWPKITQKISWLNLPLLILWAVLGELNSFFISLTLVFLSLEVFLLALNYLDKKRADWEVAGLQDNNSLETVRSGWKKFLLIFIISALILAFLLPANYQPLPMRRINSWLQQHLTETPAPVTEQSEKVSEQFDSRQSAAESQEASLATEIIFMIIQFGLYLFIAVLFLALILFLIKSELGKMKNIPQFLKAFYKFIIESFKDIFSTLKEMNFNLASSWRKRKKRRSEAKKNKEEIKDLKKVDLSESSDSIIIQIYNSLLKLLSLKGMGKKDSATPYEYSSYLEDKYNNLKEEIRELTELFVERAYSDHSLGQNAVKTAKSIWKILKKKI